MECKRAGQRCAWGISFSFWRWSSVIRPPWQIADNAKKNGVAAAANMKRSLGGKRPGKFVSPLLRKDEPGINPQRYALGSLAPVIAAHY
jgi:hypothetical protein